MEEREVSDFLAAGASRCGLAWENEIELAPASLGACAGDRPAMRDHDLAGNREPKSRPSPLLLVRRAIEPLENPPKTFARNSGPLVAHAETNKISIFRRRTQGDEAAGISVL